MKIFLTLLFMVIALNLNHAHAQTLSPWHIEVADQGCNVSDPYQANCGSLAYVSNSTTAEIFHCIGLMHSSSSSSPTTRISCRPLSSPIRGPIRLMGPRPTIIPCCGETRPNPSGQPMRDFVDYYWVVGLTIDDLRFCYLQANVCSSAPTISNAELPVVGGQVKSSPAQQ
jgi:hypothetical protein